MFGKECKSEKNSKIKYIYLVLLSHYLMIYIVHPFSRDDFNPLQNNKF